ncbi:MAG: sugar ABC transporter permease [Acidiferrobacterales bacterium]|nr:sugar ABC transporter permease [Acidiferrobacterales bacterium]
MPDALSRYPHQGIAIGLVAPAMVLMVVILFVPILIAFLLSFTSYSLGSEQLNWVGLDNYRKVFSKSTYQKMFSSTLLYVAVVVPVSVGLGLGASLLIHSLKFGQNLYKTIFFLPVMAALLAMAIAWEFALHPTIGIINHTLSAGCESNGWYSFATGSWYGNDVSTSWYGRGCEKGFPLWLGNKDYAMWTIAFIGIWQAFGFNMVLYLAGLSSISPELYHSAEIDGARSAWSRFRLVTWPMLGPTTVFVLTITLIRSFQVFDTVEALTSGGPVKSTYVMMYAIFEKAIKHNLVGIGAAITVVFLSFVMLITLIQRWLVDRRVHYA